MKKPQYELIPLRLAISQCQTNITAFQQAMINEQNKISELEIYIREWENYNKSEQSGLTDNGNYIRQY